MNSHAEAALHTSALTFRPRISAGGRPRKHSARHARRHGFARRRRSARKVSITIRTTLGLVLLTDLELDWLFLLKLYPSLISLSLLLVFGFSLCQSQTIIEKIARISEPDLAEAGVRYTRRVTYVWCVFFILNGSAALYTALFSSMKIWTLYNGLISYLLMGTLFAVEYSVRIILKRRGTI